MTFIHDLGECAHKIGRIILITVIVLASCVGSAGEVPGPKGQRCFCFPSKVVPAVSRFGNETDFITKKAVRV